jgi:hypothetical protein
MQDEIANTAEKFLENVVNFKHFGTIITSQTHIREKKTKLGQTKFWVLFRKEQNTEEKQLLVFMLLCNLISCAE